MLWPLFSRYIKLVRAIDGWCRCYTCDKPIQVGGNDCDGGHFIPRTYSPTKYDEDNVRPQCSSCNQYHEGKPVEFERRLKLEIGDDAVANLKLRSTEPWKWNRPDMVEQVKHYKALVSEYS